MKPAVDHHPNAIALVNADGSLTDEGRRLGLQNLTPQQRAAFNDQALLQEVFPRPAQPEVRTCRRQ